MENSVGAPRATNGRADTRALLTTCVAAAARGAEIVRQGAERRTSLVWESKGANDFDTEGDCASEVGKIIPVFRKLSLSCRSREFL